MINGVRVGAQTYSFRNLTRPPGGDMVDVLIRAMTECGLARMRALVAADRAGQGPARRGSPLARRDAARSLSCHPQEVQRRANIAIRAFNYSFNDSFTDAEIDRGFEMARALGAEFITASSTLVGGQARRAVCRETQDGRRDAQPFESSRTRTSSRRRKASPQR